MGTDRTWHGRLAAGAQRARLATATQRARLTATSLRARPAETALRGRLAAGAAQRAQRTRPTFGVRRRRLACGALPGRLAGLLIALGAVSGCTGGDDPRPPVPSTSQPPPVMRLVPGEPVTISAIVDDVLSASSFVVVDVNLPVGGLLVIATAQARVTVPDFVTVGGQVVLFDDARFRGYGLAEPSRYAAFVGRPAVLADRIVRRGGAPSATPG